MIEIFPNTKGFEPNRELVNCLLREMAAKGLRSDWWFCSALEDGALLFDDSEQDTNCIVAVKVGTGYNFLTEKEYWED